MKKINVNKKHLGWILSPFVIISATAGVVKGVAPVNINNKALDAMNNRATVTAMAQEEVLTDEAIVNESIQAGINTETQTSSAFDDILGGQINSSNTVDEETFVQAPESFTTAAVVSLQTFLQSKTELSAFASLFNDVATLQAQIKNNNMGEITNIVKNNLPAEEYEKYDELLEKCFNYEAANDTVVEIEKGDVITNEGVNNNQNIEGGSKVEDFENFNPELNPTPQTPSSPVTPPEQEDENNGPQIVPGDEIGNVITNNPTNDPAAEETITSNKAKAGALAGALGLAGSTILVGGIAALAKYSQDLVKARRKASKFLTGKSNLKLTKKLTKTNNSVYRASRSKKKDPSDKLLDKQEKLVRQIFMLVKDSSSEKYTKDGLLTPKFARILRDYALKNVGLGILKRNNKEYTSKTEPHAQKPADYRKHMLGLYYFAKASLKHSKGEDATQLLNKASELLNDCYLPLPETTVYYGNEKMFMVKIKIGKEERSLPIYPQRYVSAQPLTENLKEYFDKVCAISGTFERKTVYGTITFNQQVEEDGKTTVKPIVWNYAFDNAYGAMLIENYLLNLIPTKNLDGDVTVERKIQTPIKTKISKEETFKKESLKSNINYCSINALNLQTDGLSL